jgi:hypothetical protein
MCGLSRGETVGSPARCNAPRVANAPGTLDQ